MCANLWAQASWLSAVIGCVAAPQLGYDPTSGTTAKEELLYTKEIGFRIECPDGTESCLRRAEALCQGPYKMVAPKHRTPLIQVYLDGRLQTLNSANPYLIHVACKAVGDTEIETKQSRANQHVVMPQP
jgi:hypothetical protein